MENSSTLMCENQPIINIGMIGSVSAGKCLAKGTPILMYDGSIKPVEQVMIGEQIMGDDSNPRNVLSIARGNEKMYKIQNASDPDDYYICNESHILSVRGYNMPVRDISLLDYLSLPDIDQEYYQGYRTNINFLNKDIEDPYNYGFSAKLYIDERYKINSPINQLELLAGIIDNIGNVENNSIIFNKNEPLLKDIIFICHSLGFEVSKNIDSNIIISGHTSDIPSKKYKLKGQRKCLNYPICIVPLEKDDYYGFTIDGNHRFVLGNFVVTHNTTVVKALTGKNTIQHTKEKQRNITIKLGYANCKIFRCDCDEYAYQSYGSDKMSAECKRCNAPMRLERHVSFIDSPGHQLLMATMLSGSSVMDATMLLVAGNESCPQPQTSEHLAAIEILKMSKKTKMADNSIILQNKVDLLDKESALLNFNEIKTFTAGTVAMRNPIIPISAQFGLGIEAICKHICNIPIPIRTETNPIMMIIRSFDVNRPGTLIQDMVGGVAGGSIVQGRFNIGDSIIISPGVITKKDGVIDYKPIKTKVISIHSEKNRRI